MLCSIRVSLASSLLRPMPKVLMISRKPFNLEILACLSVAKSDLDAVEFPTKFELVPNNCRSAPKKESRKDLTPQGSTTCKIERFDFDRSRSLVKISLEDDIDAPITSLPPNDTEVTENLTDGLQSKVFPVREPFFR